MEVAKVIVEQLGPMAFMMMGATNKLAGERDLSFKVGKNAKGVTHVKIELDPSDTYNVTFFKVRGLKIDKVDEVTMVFVDGLKKTIEKGTGLYLSL